MSFPTGSLPGFPTASDSFQPMPYGASYMDMGFHQIPTEFFNIMYMQSTMGAATAFGIPAAMPEATATMSNPVSYQLPHSSSNAPSPYSMDNILSSTYPSTSSFPCSSTSTSTSSSKKSSPAENKNEKGQKKARRQTRETPLERAMRNPFAPKPVCKVCGDHPSGHHYDVLSCEGCKGFFRRNVVNNMVLECIKGGQQGGCRFVAGDRLARTECAACRFQQCLAAGMDPELVRPVDKRPKQLAEWEKTLSPAVYMLAVAFHTDMAFDTRISSATHAIEAIKKFICTVPAFQILLPKDQGKIEQLVEKLLPGIMAIRVAFSYDKVQCFANRNRTLAVHVEQLRKVLRTSVLRDEGLALVSGMHVLQVLNEGSGETFGIYRRSLQQYFANTSDFQEEGACDALIAKLAVLL